MLSGRKREYLYDEIIGLSDDFSVFHISPAEINQSMRSNISLNELEAIYFARALDSISVDISKLYLDSPDVVQERFGRRVGIISNKPTREAARGKKGSGQKRGVTLISEHKADMKYPVVSAASILAKVERDREIERIKESVGIDFGSGYPSDRKTVGAIKESMKSRVLMPYLREEWQTIANIRQLRMTDFFG
jgi:ribonuclease HII